VLGTNGSAIDLSELRARPRPRYSICTLMTQPAEYEQMVASFRDRGFVEPACEFMFADNSAGNRFDGFSGFNAFLAAARGDVVIVVHQDVLAIDSREALDARLADLAAIDPLWAVCGNAGRTVDGKIVVRISDSAGERRDGPFPSRVLGLDENFVVVRRAENLGLSPRLSGFHFYAKALCGVADDLGLMSYVIDFHVHHKSRGKLDPTYFEIRDALTWMRQRQYAPRILASNYAESSIVTARNPLVRRIATQMARTRFKKLVCRWVARRNRDWWA
jgi:hypothetical protein